MTGQNSTCWTMIQGAATGSETERDRFARRYLPVVRRYLGARWRGSPHRGAVDDATQEVFVDCFKEGGALDRVVQSRPGGFRAFLYGVVRNVALRVEDRARRQREKQASTEFDADALGRDEARLSGIFDRAWAESLVRQAVALQRDRARADGERATRRVELLTLRFNGGRKIREIAEVWGADTAFLHREYRRARQEFHAALLDVVAFHHPAPAEEVEQECVELLGLLD